MYINAQNVCKSSVQDTTVMHEEVMALNLNVNLM